MGQLRAAGEAEPWLRAGHHRLHPQQLCLHRRVAGFAAATLREFRNWGSTSYNGTEQPLWSMKEDLNYIRCAHTLKFGFSFQSQRANGYGQQDISGRAGFSYLGTSVPAATSFTSGSSFASFLLGDAQSGRTETNRFVPQLYRYYGFYAQDDWRVSRKLTIN